MELVSSELKILLAEEICSSVLVTRALTADVSEDREKVVVVVMVVKVVVVIVVAGTEVVILLAVVSNTLPVVVSNPDVVIRGCVVVSWGVVIS